MKRIISDKFLLQVINGDKPYFELPFLYTEKPKLVYSGSFNPVHAGHKQIVLDAEKRFNAQVYFEISVTNCDKGNVSLEDIKKRIIDLEISGVGHGVYITNAPLFGIKAEMFPDCRFIVGADTMSRVIDPKYYGLKYWGDSPIYKKLRSIPFIVYPRVGYKVPYVADWNCEVVCDFAGLDLSSSKIRGESC